MSGEWIAHDGRYSCPVADGKEYELKFDDGDVRVTTAPKGWNWRMIEAYRVVEEDVEGKPSPITSDGGSSEYYKLTIKNKAGETISCELGDIIRAVVGNDFNLGNILKAARRMHLAAQGVGKDGTSVSYDANKIKWFAEEFAFWNEVE